MWVILPAFSIPRLHKKVFSVLYFSVEYVVDKKQACCRQVRLSSVDYSYRWLSMHNGFIKQYDFCLYYSQRFSA